MTSRAARLWFLVPLVSPGAAWGDIIALYTFNPKQDNCDRMGPGYEATAFDELVLATDVSISESVPPSAECYIENTDPPYDTRVLRFEPGPGSTSADQAVMHGRHLETTLAAAR